MNINTKNDKFNVQNEFMGSLKQYKNNWILLEQKE